VHLVGEDAGIQDNDLFVFFVFPWVYL
jgi:hypothetical protein